MEHGATRGSIDRVAYNDVVVRLDALAFNESWLSMRGDLTPWPVDLLSRDTSTSVYDVLCRLWIPHRD
jgi:hypothetical protein